MDKVEALAGKVVDKHGSWYNTTPSIPYFIVFTTR